MTQTEDLAQFDPASFEHIPVLLNECLDGLNIDPAGTYLDGTAGGAGHSRQIALRLDGAKGGRLVSLDQDPDAVQTARARLAGLPATVVQINFRYAGQALESLGIEKINGALLDLGVSSHQLDDAARGFSYRADAPLDMRMSQQGETAADLVNTASREEISRILRDYGEEPYAWQIAGHIVEARETAPIETTLQLADIVASAMPPAERRKNKNPSRRTFQALRIAVNHELDALEQRRQSPLLLPRTAVVDDERTECRGSRGRRVPFRGAGRQVEHALPALRAMTRLRKPEGRRDLRTTESENPSHSSRGFRFTDTEKT